MCRLTLSVFAALVLAAGIASAESLAVKAVMSPKEHIHVDLPTAQKHFVLLVRREGKAAGTGVLDGAHLTEYGMHDIRPGVDGSPHGYLVAKLTSGDQLVLRWEVQAVFVPGPDGTPRLLDNGVWRVVGGTGSADGVRGAGFLRIRAVSAQDREFELTGEPVPVRE